MSTESSVSLPRSGRVNTLSSPRVTARQTFSGAREPARAFILASSRWTSMQLRIFSESRAIVRRLRTMSSV